MANCNGCREPMCGDEPDVKCFTCSSVYHFDCCGLKEGNYRKMGAERKQAWKCPACKRGSNTFASTPEPEDVFDPTTCLSIKDVACKLADLCTSIREMKEALKFQTKTYDELMVKLEEERKENKNMQRRIAALECENESLKKELKLSVTEGQELNQYGRNRNIEIHGIQERQGEKVKELVLELAKNLRIDCKLEEVDVAHRVPTTGNKRKPIIVQFTNRTTRDKFIAKRKTGLVSNNLVQGSDDQEIFINENLSPYKKKLHWQARTQAKSLHFKFCWVRNGCIFLRKSEDTPKLLIQTEEDIPKLPGKQMPQV